MANTNLKEEKRSALLLQNRIDTETRYIVIRQKVETGSLPKSKTRELENTIPACCTVNLKRLCAAGYSSQIILLKRSAKIKLKAFQ